MHKLFVKKTYFFINITYKMSTLRIYIIYKFECSWCPLVCGISRVLRCQKQHALIWRNKYCMCLNTYVNSFIYFWLIISYKHFPRTFLRPLTWFSIIRYKHTSLHIYVMCIYLWVHVVFKKCSRVSLLKVYYVWFEMSVERLKCMNRS